MTEQPRYFTPDGQIDFEFIREMRLGLVYDISDQEHAVLEAYFFGREAGVVLLLAKRGEITMLAEGTSTAAQYRAYLDGRYRQRSANGRGRKTHGR
jgi:hypothetical protein